MPDELTSDGVQDEGSVQNHSEVIVSRTAYLLIAFLTLAGCSRAQPPAAAPTPARNLLIITVDTLRADRVGAYGYSRAQTPAMDALAARGVRFERAYATAPITLTSHASLMTGVHNRFPDVASGKWVRCEWNGQFNDWELDAADC